MECKHPKTEAMLTYVGIYDDMHGNELKKFNTHDGKGFELLRNKGIKTALITSENTPIVEARAKKMQVDYLYQGESHNGKLNAALEICKRENLTLEACAYMGDDINCKELLSNVAIAACPKNAVKEVKNIPNIIETSLRGGEGAVREFIDILLR